MRFKVKNTTEKERLHSEKIIEALKKKENHCPCKLVQNEDTLCPCKEAREQMVCHCGLYIITED